MVILYFNIGKLLNELIDKYHLESSQNKIIKEYSTKLTRTYGKGFDTSNLRKMKKFYLTYQDCATVWHNLSWSHNRIIMNIDNKKKRFKINLSYFFINTLSSVLVFNFSITYFLNLQLNVLLVIGIFSSPNRINTCSLSSLVASYIVSFIL